MAPIEPTTANSNALPLFLLATQTTIITILLGTITRFIFKVHSYLPPSQNTRHAHPWHKKSIALFSLLALTSLGFATYNGLAWRYASYQNWAKLTGASTPSSFWDGWYPRSEVVDDGFTLGSLKTNVEGWMLERWMKETDLVRECNDVALGTGSGFWWTYQGYVGLVVWSVFVGVEGRHRNIPSSTTLSLILLAQLSSLPLAQSLFFIILLLTPIPLSTGSPTNSESHILAPHPSLISVPALISFIALAYLGQSKTEIYNAPLWTSLVSVGYFALPLLLALLVQPNYLHKVRRFKSTVAARKSYEDIFRSLSVAIIALHAYFTYMAIITDSPPKRYLGYNYVWNTHSKESNSWAGQAWGILGRVTGALSDNPIISQVGWDVILSTLSLCAWAVIHGVDVGGMLRSSGLQWSIPSPSLPAMPKVSNGSASVGPEEFEKAGDAIEELAENLEVEPLPAKSRGRGRPRKTSQQISKDRVYAHSSSSTPNTTSASGSLRRSTRSQPVEQDEESVEDEEFIPTKATEEEVDRYDFDEGHEEGLARETEAGVLGWGLFVLGGLGMLSCGVLGGECSGR